MDVKILEVRDEGTMFGVLCVDIDTDQLFTSAQVDVLADWLTARGVEARRATVRSPHGHDAFLIEWEALDPLVRGTLGSTP